jgi:homoserine O-acetyltransferase
MMGNRVSSTPQAFDLRLAPLELEAGGVVTSHLVRGWWWGPDADLPALQARARVIPAESMDRGADKITRRSARELQEIGSPTNVAAPTFPNDIPTVVTVHALTGDMRTGGAGGWWAPVIGPGRALDPSTHRILCFNNLGSCYGTSGPADEGFPMQATTPVQPAVVTTWDQARSILAALDALGIEQVDLLTGGSLGGMITLCLAALAPERFRRIAPIAATEAASPWIIGWNHVARSTLLLDPNYPESPDRGLELARQLAMLTYRAEPGLDERQGRAMANVDGWAPPAPYRIETYLEHQGAKLRNRFHAFAYLAQLGAMDHHDLGRPPGTGQGGTSWGIDRIRASVLAVDIDTDQLYFPEQTHRLAQRLRERGRTVETFTIRSRHGHDAFLIEWSQVDALLRRALALPA